MLNQLTERVQSQEKNRTSKETKELVSKEPTIEEKFIEHIEKDRTSEKEIR